MLLEAQRQLLNFETVREELLTSSGIKADYDLIWKPSDNKVLGMLPKDQYVISHTEAVQRLEEVLKREGLDTGTSIAKFQLLRNGARMFIHYRLPDEFKMEIDVGGNPDKLFPEIVLRNGYDPNTPFGLEWGIYREVCSNGARMLVLGQQATRKVTMGDVDIDVMVKGVQSFIGEMLGRLTARIQAMAVTTSPNLAESTRKWLGQLMSQKMVEQYDDEVTKQIEINQGKLLTEWQMFNVLTYLATHRINSYSRQRAMELQVARRFQFGAKSRLPIVELPLVDAAALS